MASPLKVLLVSPGYTFSSDGNFGIPHLVALGSWLESQHGCDVHLLELDYEKRLPQPNPQMLFDTDFDLVGISCYSSYEFLKSFYLGVEIRARNPNVCLVVGGYHPSARPADFTGEDSPFDHVVIGEGELPLSRIVDALEQGERLDTQVLGPEQVNDLDTLPLHNWSLLDRYKPVYRRIGGQQTFYLSRGCPFRCVFCMEAAMDSRWRAFSPERSELELRRLAEAFDLTGRTLFLTDPLFGVKRSWRRDMLERFQRIALPADKIWVLSRADLLEDGDIEALHAANFGVGCGLESGDVEMLGIIHKGGKPDDYLRRFERLAEHAARIQFPWGANVIAGHPGETPDSLERSADWIGRMIRETRGPTGFVSIDPYRFYPGSPIDHRFHVYAERYGTHVYRPRWWNYSELAFCSEWVDPSRDLDYRTKNQLMHKLFGPIVRDLGERYNYTGSASAYFRRSVDHAIQVSGPRHRLAYIRDFCLWQRLTERGDDDVRTDPEAAELLREERARVVARIVPIHQPHASQALVEALIEEPRQRYVDARLLWPSTQDEALPLKPDHSATLSALHAYLNNYTLLGLEPGHRLLEFGAGTGYGAAIAQRLVGPRGAVTSFEIDPELAEIARNLLSAYPHVEIHTGSHLDAPPHLLTSYTHVLFSFCLPEIPPSLLDALAPGAVLLAPLGNPTHQILTRFTRRPDGSLHTEALNLVRYVFDQTQPQRPPVSPGA